MSTESMDFLPTFTGEPSQTTTDSVLCAVCPKRAFKSCLTCVASFCELHVRHHYTAPDLQRHQLVDATDDLEQRLCPQHHRELEFYCRTDQTPVCALCAIKQHRGHDIAEQMKEWKLPPRKRKEQFDRASTKNHLIQLIAKCELIKAGFPACYLLPVEDSPEVRRWIYGKRDRSKPTKTILIVGETGTGKTTLINTMINYILGVERKDRAWFQITEENNKTTSSQTSTITVSELFLETNSSCLRIIDTPGFQATDDIVDHLDLFFQSEDDIHRIEVVGLVVNARQNHVTELKKNIYNDILSLFGKDMDEKIVVFITQSHGRPAENVISALEKANVPCAKDASGKPLYFMFNNQQRDNYAKEQDDHYKAMWDLGNQSLKTFFNILETFKGTKVTMTKDVLREHKKLKAKRQDATQIENQLKQIQRAFEEIEVNMLDMVKVPINSKWWHLNKGATVCTICMENCHYPYCWWVKDLSWCSVMKNNKCTVCVGKCHYTDHVKGMFRYVPNTKKMNKKEDIRNKLRDAKAKECRLLEEISQCTLKLQNIALRPTRQDKTGLRPSDGGGRSPSDGGESSSSNKRDRPHMQESVELKEIGRGNVRYLRRRRGQGPSHRGDRQHLLAGTDESDLDL